MTWPNAAIKVPRMGAPRPAETSQPDRKDAGARSYLVADQRVAARPLAPGLYLVATPIGNLGDVTLRALETLAAADLIACEDTRITVRLLERYGIRTPLTPYHDHNATTARPKLVKRLVDGAAVALVSDARTPLVSDPGYKLVCAAQEAGVAVTAVPPPSAAPPPPAVPGRATRALFFRGVFAAQAR